MPPTPSPLVSRFCAGQLPPEEWTHEAHLRVAHELLAEIGDPGCLVVLLRILIGTHNDRCGVPPERGYHETITRYYVTAVAALADRPIDEVLADPSCARTAPGRHWSREALCSAEARDGWVEPDLLPLPAAWPDSDPAACCRPG